MWVSHEAITNALSLEQILWTSVDLERDSSKIRLQTTKKLNCQKSPVETSTNQAFWFQMCTCDSGLIYLLIRFKTFSITFVVYVYSYYKQDKILVYFSSNILEFHFLKVSSSNHIKKIIGFRTSERTFLFSYTFLLFSIVLLFKFAFFCLSKLLSRESLKPSMDHNTTEQSEVFQELLTIQVVIDEEIPFNDFSWFNLSVSGKLKLMENRKFLRLNFQKSYNQLVATDTNIYEIEILCFPNRIFQEWN